MFDFVISVVPGRWPGTIKNWAIFKYNNAKLTIIGLDNGLSPVQSQTIIWISAKIYSMDPSEQT